MCRRLLETLIIEAYEAHKCEQELKNSDGYYLMFSGLLARVEGSNQLNVGRNALKGLKHFKKIGDLSAHNRRFNATKPDLDSIQSDLRIASEDLLHIAGQGP